MNPSSPFTPSESATDMNLILFHPIWRTESELMSVLPDQGVSAHIDSGSHGLERLLHSVFASKPQPENQRKAPAILLPDYLLFHWRGQIVSK